MSPGSGTAAGTGSGVANARQPAPSNETGATPSGGSKAKSPSAKTIRAPESATMKRIVSAGSLMLTITGTQPARIAPNSATRFSRRLSAQIATRSPRPSPRAASPAAIAPQARSSSRWLSVRGRSGSNRSITAGRSLPAWAANTQPRLRGRVMAR